MVPKLFGLQRRWRGQKIHSFSAFTCIDKDKREHLQKAGVNIHLMWRKMCFSVLSRKRGAGLDSRGGLKGEAQKSFSCVLTVPLTIVIVFILGLGKSW